MQSISRFVLKSILHMSSTQLKSKGTDPLPVRVAASQHSLLSVALKHTLVFATKAVTNRWNELFLSAAILSYM